MRKILPIACLALCACGVESSESTISSASTVSTGAGVQHRVSGTDLAAVEREGIDKICTYRAGPNSTTFRTYRVGLAQPCPNRMPTSGKNFPMPPTARHVRSTISEGMRACVYGQGAREWTVNLPLEKGCPLSGGLAVQAEAEGKQDVSRRRRTPPPE